MREAKEDLADKKNASKATKAAVDDQKDRAGEALVLAATNRKRQEDEDSCGVTVSPTKMRKTPS